MRGPSAIDHFHALVKTRTRLHFNRPQAVSWNFVITDSQSTGAPNNTDVSEMDCRVSYRFGPEYLLLNFILT